MLGLTWALKLGSGFLINLSVRSIEDAIFFLYPPPPPTELFLPPCISPPSAFLHSLIPFALTTFFHSSVRSLPPQLSSGSLYLVSCHCHVRCSPSETVPTSNRALKLPMHPTSVAARLGLGGSGSRQRQQPLMVARRKTSAHGTGICVCPSKPEAKVGQRRGKEKKEVWVAVGCCERKVRA